MVIAAAPLGDAAVRCVVDDLAEAHALHAALMGAGLPGVVNVVPTWRCVVVMLDAPDHRAGVLEFVSALDVASLPDAPARRHELPIFYDGADLADVARQCGMTPAEVAAAHSAADYVVAFLGFAPGFPYLAGLPEALAVARKETPRQQVPAGAVGIADRVTGIYPAASPGGWQIVGRVEVRLWDEHATPPALLAPGDHVRFAPA